MHARPAAVAAPADTLLGELGRLARLAWPVVVVQLGLVAMGVVDMLLVGRLGETAIAAVGIGNTLSFGALVVGLGTASGIDPLVAQASGRGDRAAAATALLQGVVVLLTVAVPIVGIHAAAGPLLHLLGQPEASIPDARAYCRILSLGVLPFLGFALLRQYLQGFGHMMPAMWVILAANGVNGLAAWMLVGGRLGAPELGVAGAAWATVLARWLMLGGLLVAARRSLGDLGRGGWGALTVAGVAATAAVTVPVGLQLGLEVWAFNLAAVLAGLLGPTALASHTVALSLCSVTFMIPLGISAAAAARVGNLVGAGQPWGRAALAALGVSSAAMTVSASCFWIAPALWVGLYTDEAAVLAVAATVLPLAAIFQLADGLQVTSFGILRGLADTRVPTAFNLVGHWLVGIPLGATLGLGLGHGLWGVWVGLSAGLIVVAALLLVRMTTHRPR